MAWEILIFGALLLNAMILWSGFKAISRKIQAFQEVVIGVENTMSHYAKSINDKLDDLKIMADEASSKGQ